MGKWEQRLYNSCKKPRKEGSLGAFLAGEFLHHSDFTLVLSCVSVVISSWRPMQIKYCTSCPSIKFLSFK